MSFTSTRHIFERVESALEYDLLGQTDADSDVDSDVNGHLSSPLNSTAVCERVERYVIDPVGAGDLYAMNKKTGLTVGYSFSQQQPDQPVSGTGASLSHIVPVEITVIRVVTQIADLIDGQAGYDVDDVMDDVMRIFGRRDGPDFGVQTVNLAPVQQLDGGSAEAPWHGRTLRIAFRRSHKALQT